MKQNLKWKCKNCGCKYGGYEDGKVAPHTCFACGCNSFVSIDEAKED